MVLSTRMKVLCAVAAAVGVYVVASGPDPSSAVVESTSSNARDVHSVNVSSIAVVPGARVDSRSVAHDTGSLFSRLAHRVTESKAVGALFHSQSWYVAPPPPPPAPYVAPPPPPPPTAPPLPFSVMGSYARPGDSKVYFLTRGDRVFDVHIGDTIDNTYSVDSEANGTLTLTYKPLNIQQTLAVGGS